MRRHFWSLSLPACDLLQLGYLFMCERFAGLGWCIFHSEESPREKHNWKMKQAGKVLCNIPGSSKCVKFVPFHPKKHTKGRNFTYLENPGMDVSENSGFSPQIIHLNRVFHDFHYPFWGPTPNFCKHPYLGKISVNPKPAVSSFFWGGKTLILNAKSLPHISPTTASATHFEGLEKGDHSNDRESN